jgi:hypothetical protein
VGTSGNLHVSGRLSVPANITLVPLPPYSPELNPIERLRQHLDDNWRSDRIFHDLGAVVAACCDAENAVLAETGRSGGHSPGFSLAVATPAHRITRRPPPVEK